MPLDDKISMNANKKNVSRILWFIVNQVPIRITFQFRYEVVLIKSIKLDCETLSRAHQFAFWTTISI